MFGISSMNPPTFFFCFHCCGVLSFFFTRILHVCHVTHVCAAMMVFCFLMCLLIKVQEVLFDNSIGNFMVCQDRLATNSLQLFANPETSAKWISIISVIILKLTFLLSRNKHNL